MSDFKVDLYAEHGEDFHSSSIDIVGYDRESKTLYVEFHSSGDVYSYDGVEESTYNLLVSAPSVGKFYAHHIKEAGYSGAKHIDGECIVLRDEPADDPIKPEQKWLSVPEGETPDFAQGGLVSGGGEIRISGDGLFASGVLTIPVVKPTRYAVEYTVEHDGTSGRYKPEFQAMSEADALAQFNEALNGLTTVLGWNDVKVKIVSVTHYLD